MIHANKVLDRAGSPTVWITNTVNDDPEDRAPNVDRVVWTVGKPNSRLVRVTARERRTMFNGCAHGLPDHRSIELDELPAGHLDELKTKLKLEFCGYEVEQVVEFTQDEEDAHAFQTGGDRDRPR